MLSVAACGEINDLKNDDVVTVTSAINHGELHLDDYLFATQELWSTNCAFGLHMQSDGNLVAREYPSGAAMWSSRTSGNTRAYAEFAANGGFIIKPKNGGFPLWGVGPGGVRLTMQNDGNVVLRSQFHTTGSIVWATNTQRTADMACFGGGQQTTRLSKATRIYPDTDKPGLDMAPSPIMGVSWTACGSECSTRPACKTWTWEPPSGGAAAKCWIKNGNPPTWGRPGLITGVVFTFAEGVIQ
jgi:hypothetical protein